jgi:predicted acetyltransferase
MAYETRTVRPDEVIPWLECVTTGFLDRPNVAKIAEQLGPYWDFTRLWGTFDGPVVGTLRSWATEVTVPGGALVPASAISGVTVRPTHRRRGILRQMITAEHAAARERGEHLAILYVSQAPIYGRFGYGVGIQPCTWVVDTRSTAFVGGPATGMDLLPVEEATSELMKNLFDQLRRAWPGEIRRRDFSFAADIGLIEIDWEGPWKGWVAVHRDEAGDPDGFVRYTAKENWEHHQPRSSLNVRDLVALNDSAYDALWRFLAEIDFVATIQADRRSSDERLPWILTNRRAAEATDLVDGLWVNILDIPAALAARTYEREGDVVIEVIGGEPAGTRTRVRLEAGPDGVACATTTRDADLTIHADALGAAYLGGSPLRNSVLTRGFDEHRPGALAEAEALFRTLVPPRCSTFF